ncbi:MAG: hypothetical protein AB9846_02700 [Tenuifilaceae bacterium]
MKKIIFLLSNLFITVLIVLCNSCSKDFEQFDVSNYSCLKLDTITFTHSMKGWELYSWPYDSKWKYSILIGTNALKTFEQITNNPIGVIGEDSLKVVLNKLPSGEEIFWKGPVWLGIYWGSNPRILTLPPRSIQIEIKEFCDNKNLKLYIAD